MNETLNIGNAILILGVLYLNLAYHLNDFVSALLVILAATTWAYHGFTNERQALLKAQIRLLEAKSNYFDRKK